MKLGDFSVKLALQDWAQEVTEAKDCCDFTWLRAKNLNEVASGFMILCGVRQDKQARWKILGKMENSRYFL